MKQSSYTGQETFFPREQILSRIQSILDLKDQYSLEELARLLSPEKAVTKITMEQLQDISEIGHILTDLPRIFGKEEFDFLDIVVTAGLVETADRIDMTEDQIKDLLQKSIASAVRQKSTNITCTIFRIGNSFHTAFSPNAIPVFFDDELEVKAQISLSEIADKLRIKYNNKFK